MEMTHRQVQRLEVEWASGINVVLGLWLILSTFAFGLPGQLAVLWNNVIAGTLITVLAFIVTIVPERNPAMSWANAVLGVWLIVSPFILGYSGVAAALWNDIIVGLAVLGLAAWSALETRSLSSSAMQP